MTSRSEQRRELYQEANALLREAARRERRPPPEPCKPPPEPIAGPQKLRLCDLKWAFRQQLMNSK
jgi:hypothetical protein